VSAKDLGTGKENKIRIEGSSGLSEAEVERMRKEAESHAEEDRRKRELIDARNQADNLIYQTEKMLKEHGEKVPADERGKVESAINNLRDRLKGDDAGAIKKASEAVMTASQTLGKIIYEQAAKAGGGGVSGGAPGGDGVGGKSGGGSSSAKKDDDVIDAEFEVKK
jgi:molecular chaperone DnaK